MRDQHDGEVILDGEATKQSDELPSLSPRVLFSCVHVGESVEHNEARLYSFNQGDEPAKDGGWSDEACLALWRANNGILAGQGHDMKVGEVR
jgi:hypothetical protein